jgi:hypothetical protein
MQQQLPWVWIDPRVDIPQWLAGLIGRIAAEWSELEWQYEEIIRLLADIPIRSGRVITTGMNMKSRVMVATNFAQGLAYKNLLPVEVFREVKAQATSITENLERERNKVVHGLWGRREGHWHLLRTSGARDGAGLPEIGRLSRSVLPQREKMTRTEIGGILGRITTARKKADALRTQLEAALPASQNESPRQISLNHRNLARKRKRLPSSAS